MSFIEVEGLSEVQEGKIHPEGMVDLRVDDAEQYTNDKGRDVIRCRIRIEEEGEWMPFMHFLAMPMEEDDQDKRKTIIRSMKRFLYWFNVPMEDNGFAVEDITGCTANLMIIQQESQDETSDDMFNALKLPRVPNAE